MRSLLRVFRVRTRHVLFIGALRGCLHPLLYSCQVDRDTTVSSGSLSLSLPGLPPRPAPPRVLLACRPPLAVAVPLRKYLHHIPLSCFLSSLVPHAFPGATSALSPPPGSLHPAELLEECALDGETLLRLTKEGWLELSPAAPPMWVLL